MANSVYIHIPFCKSKCKYCSFVSFPRLELINEYVEALMLEIDLHYKGEKLKTLYFGGGTPSLLPAKAVKRIVERFKLNEETEVTFEINPDDADLDYLKALRKIGINRLSIGSQSFDDKVLKQIGRRHNAEDIINCIQLSKKAGFENVSVDLIYGLPEADIKSDLENLLKLDVQHVSTYGLKIEENSFWGKHPPLNLPNEDAQADMYEEVNDFLERNEFYRYEVSNFAKKGFESRHNLNYWDNSEYYGFGVAAHGYLNGVRYSNFCTLEEYIKNPHTHQNEHELSEQEKLEEEIFLGFRKADGIDVNKIKDKFGVDFESEYKRVLEKYSDYFEKTAKGYTLNLQGVLISNIILAEFI